MGVVDKMSGESPEMREKAFRICRDYLNGAWKHITCQEMVLKHISGGLSNWLYYCALPASHPPCQGEPSQVLLRLYGQVHGGERALEGIITESVIFTLLSERRLGPRLFGVFPGGRLEEYIPARPLKTKELWEKDLSLLIAEKMALIHSMNVPISKEPKWLWDTMDRWMKSVKEVFRAAKIDDESNCASVQKLVNYRLDAELEWLKRYLNRVQSPVVFSHNDMQEGNILMREGARSREEKLVFIDFEYCSYNYRGFDLANHFCEWMYDYTLPASPNFTASVQNYPSREQQLGFVQKYLHTLQQQGAPVVKQSDEDSVLKEIAAFTLASHFFWGLWSVVNAQVSQIPFGYWDYATTRFDAYFQHKATVVSTLGDAGVKRKAEEIQ